MSKNWNSRESVLNYLDNYASQLKDQIDTGKTVHTLLKSYIFETFNKDHHSYQKNGQSYGISALISTKEAEILQIDEQLFQVNRGKETLGFVEQLNERFSVLYSIDLAQRSDAYFHSIIKKSPIIDSLWISGKMFDAFWANIREEHSSHRYIKMKFEYDGFFEDPYLLSKSIVKQDGNEIDDDILDEHRITSISLIEEAKEIAEKLDGARGLFEAFYSVGLLRFPSRVGKGGHDFYRNGKVTNRSDSFLDHRHQIISAVNKYEAVTDRIESITWIDFESFKAPNKEVTISFQGSPIVFKFRKPLRKHVFRNFVDFTFKNGREPFKILGQPIWVNEERTHIYGTDLHLWQKVMLDLSPEQFVLFIPKGTCGNTIHRFVTNIQRFLDPGVSVQIGNQSYEYLLESSFERGGFDDGF
jgi:hypothetical protein